MRIRYVRKNLRSLCRIHTVALFCICTLYFLLCIWGNLRNWTNYDEAFTNVYSNMNLDNILSVAKYESSPPLHYLTYHLWFAIFGSGLFSARLLASIFGVGCIVMVYFLGKSLANNSKNAGVVCAIVCSIIPVSSHLASEGRYFTMLAFYQLVATFALLKIYPLQKAKFELTSRQVFAWHFLYALFITLSFYSSYMAIFLFPAHLLWVAFHLISDYKNAKRSIQIIKKPLINVLWTACVLIIMNIPLLYCYLHSTRLNGGNITGIENKMQSGYNFMQNTLNSLFNANFTVETPKFYLFIMTQILLVIIYTLAVIFAAKSRELRPCFIFLALLIFFPLTCVILSPTLGFANYRYVNGIFYFLAIGIGLIISRLISNLKKKRISLLACILLSVLLVGTCAYGAKPFLQHKGGQTSGVTDFGIVNAIDQTNKKYTGNMVIIDPPAEPKTWPIIVFSSLNRNDWQNLTVYVHNFDEQIFKRFENCSPTFCNNKKFIDLLIKNSPNVIQGDELYNYIMDNNVKYLLAYQNDQLNELEDKGMSFNLVDTFCNDIDKCVQLYSHTTIN